MDRNTILYEFKKEKTARLAIRKFSRKQSKSGNFIYNKTRNFVIVSLWVVF